MCHKESIKSMQIMGKFFKISKIILKLASLSSFNRQHNQSIAETLNLIE